MHRRCRSILGVEHSTGTPALSLPSPSGSLSRQPHPGHATKRCRRAHCFLGTTAKDGLASAGRIPLPAERSPSRLWPAAADPSGCGAITGLPQATAFPRAPHGRRPGPIGAPQGWGSRFHDHAPGAATSPGRATSPAASRAAAAPQGAGGGGDRGRPGPGPGPSRPGKLQRPQRDPRPGRGLLRGESSHPPLAAARERAASTTHLRPWRRPRRGLRLRPRPSPPTHTPHRCPARPPTPAPRPPNGSAACRRPPRRLAAGRARRGSLRRAASCAHWGPPFCRTEGRRAGRGGGAAGGGAAARTGTASPARRLWERLATRAPGEVLTHRRDCRGVRSRPSPAPLSSGDQPPAPAPPGDAFDGSAAADRAARREADALQSPGGKRAAPGATPPFPHSPRSIGAVRPCRHQNGCRLTAAAILVTAVPYRNPFPIGGGAAGVTWLRHLAVRLAEARAGGRGPGRARPAAAAAGDGDLLRRRQLLQPAGEGAPGRRLLPQVRAAARPASAPRLPLLRRCRGRACLTPRLRAGLSVGWGRLRVPAALPSPCLPVRAPRLRAPGASGRLCFPGRRGPALRSAARPETGLAAGSCPSPPRGLRPGLTPRPGPPPAPTGLGPSGRRLCPQGPCWGCCRR